MVVLDFKGAYKGLKWLMKPSKAAKKKKRPSKELVKPLSTFSAKRRATAKNSVQCANSIHLCEQNFMCDMYNKSIIYTINIFTRPMIVC